MSTRPPSSVVRAIENGDATITRRVDLFEADGETPYLPGGSDESRLIGGNVTVDYGRDERRGIDLTLDNTDNALRPEPNDGLWYDKVIKAYRGVTVNGKLVQPKVLVAYAPTAAIAAEGKGTLRLLGYTDITTHVGIAGSLTAADLVPYDVIFVYRKADTTATWDNPVLAAAYDSGKSVIIQSVALTAANTPQLFTAAVAGPQGFAYEPTPGDNQLKGGWTGDNTYVATVAGTVRLTALAAGVRAVAREVGTTDILAALKQNDYGGRWFVWQIPGFSSANSLALLNNAMQWVSHQSAMYEWETQLGEFMIDGISEDSRPRQTKITGRDYTKKCLVSKFEKTVAFDELTPISTFVRALASNAGVKKFNFPDTVETIGSGMMFDRTVERWAAMKAACESNNYELYFDLNGALTMRPYYDPVSSPFAQTFQTGLEGNLVDWSRSTNDSRLYNHIIVTGESGQEGSIPFFGEARNEEPGSPTRIERIGDRSYFFTSGFFTSDEQCQQLALRWLKEKALESYEVGWTSLAYPWLEVGEIVEFLDPRRYAHEPTRFLMDTLNIPLGLGPMSATAKRVTFVNDPGLALA